MDKKILICGSSIAVVVLVLAGLSPVVGYNSIKSSVKDSPLFNIRTKRAIDEESETLTCNYLRKGQLMLFPTRNSKTAIIQKAFDRIGRMDDKSFDRLVNKIISYINQDNEIDNIVINDKEIKDMLYQLRGNSELIENNIMLIENKEPQQLTIHITSWECILLFLLILLSLPFAIIITIIRFIFDIIRFIFEIIQETNPSLPTVN